MFPEVFSEVLPEVAIEVFPEVFPPEVSPVAALRGGGVAASAFSSWLL